MYYVCTVQCVTVLIILRVSVCLYKEVAIMICLLLPPPPTRLARAVWREPNL